MNTVAEQAALSAQAAAGRAWSDFMTAKVARRPAEEVAALEADYLAAHAIEVELVVRLSVAA